MSKKKFLLFSLPMAAILMGIVLWNYLFTIENAQAEEKKEEHILFARLTIAPIKEGKMDDLMKIYKESIVPAAKAQEGYQGAYLLTNKETSKAISVTVWDSEEDAIANEQSGYYKEQVAKAVPCFSGAPVREGYEISVSDAPARNAP